MLEWGARSATSWFIHAQFVTTFIKHNINVLFVGLEGSNVHVRNLVVQYDLPTRVVHIRVLAVSGLERRTGKCESWTVSWSELQLYTTRSWQCHDGYVRQSKFIRHSPPCRFYSSHPLSVLPYGADCSYQLNASRCMVWEERVAYVCIYTAPISNWTYQRTESFVSAWVCAWWFFINRTCILFIR